MSIFREYDIRGIVGKDLSPDLAENLGKAFGTVLRRKKIRRIAVGRDGRTVSRMLSRQRYRYSSNTGRRQHTA